MIRPSRCRAAVYCTKGWCAANAFPDARTDSGSRRSPYLLLVVKRGRHLPEDQRLRLAAEDVSDPGFRLVAFSILQSYETTAAESSLRASSCCPFW